MELTIVIPVHNREHLLGRTLRSIASGQMLPHTLILVDNGSTDGSMALCRKFKEENETDNFHIIIAEEPRKGANAARNKGLSLCTTEWVYFFDSDDLFDREFVSAVSSIRNDGIDCMICPTRMDVNGKTVTRDFKAKNDIPFQILTGMLSTQAVVYRTEWLRSIGGWDEDLDVWQDLELGTRLLLHNPAIHWMPERAFHAISVHAESITGKRTSDNADGRLQAIRRINGQLTAPPHRKALVLRTYILLGMFMREHDGEAIKKGKEFIQELFADDFSLLGRAIATYVKFGGRGAWRLAYRLAR